MNYWLAKTDPDTYSLDTFEKEGTTIWDGVHNYAAIGFIKQMARGDLDYIYESMTTKCIAGIARVTGEPFLNTADPRHSWAVELQFIKKFENPLSLATIKADTRLQKMELVRQSRLSVCPIRPDEQAIINNFLS
jgi:predicted RNA-binding protein with PUA-like domain